MRAVLMNMKVSAKAALAVIFRSPPCTSKPVHVSSQLPHEPWGRELWKSLVELLMFEVEAVVPQLDAKQVPHEVSGIHVNARVCLHRHSVRDSCPEPCIQPLESGDILESVEPVDVPRARLSNVEVSSELFQQIIDQKRYVVAGRKIKELDVVPVCVDLCQPTPV